VKFLAIETARSAGAGWYER